MTRDIRIGLIGFGWMGQAHSRAYRAIPTYFPDENIFPRLVSVAESDPSRMKLAISNFGYESGTPQWRELVARPDLDVIDITAPTAMHREIAEAAAAAGRHVFCEKPVGINPAETASIEHAARTAGVINGCGYNYRWAPMVQHTKNLINEGRFGNLTHYRGRFFSMYGRDRLGVLSWRFLQDQAGFGALTDIMSHAVDMALHLAGPIKRLVSTKNIFVEERPLPVSGKGTHYDRGSADDPTGTVTNEDYVAALVEFENGVHGTLEADRSIFGPQSSMGYELNGSQGAASWDHEKLNQLKLYLPREQPTDGFIEVLSGDAFPHQANFVPGGGNSVGYEALKVIEALEFLKAVASHSEHHPNFSDALAVAGVLDAMTRSWQSEQWESITDLSIP